MPLSLQREIRVLHVDDDPSIRDLTGTFLEREDDRFSVETAASAEETVRRIRDQPPDCVVSDYNMPGMDGLKLLQAVREEYPDLPFILFTGKGSETVASDAIAAGVTDYLQKQSGTEQYELLANRILNAVTTRRETRRADRQEQLMRLTEFAGDTGGFELDRESREILLTAGTRRMIGRPDTFEISLGEAIELFHPDDRESIQRTLDEAFETGEELHDRWRLQPDDGDQRLLDVTITPVVKNGEVTKLRGAGHDITDRTERQRELTQIETLFQHTQDALFLVDAGEEFTVERVNPAWEDATGLSAERVRRQTPRDVLGEQSGAAAEEKYRECIQRQEPLNYEETVRLDGEITHWETQIAPVVVDGSVEYIAGATRDVTEHRERQRDLNQARDLMTNMEQLADTGAWEYDSDSETLVMTGGACRIYGLEPDSDLTLEEAFEPLHPDDRERLTDRFDECLDSGEPYEVDARLTTVEGAQRWVRARGERADAPESGSDPVVRGYVQDITERKRRERQLTELNHASEDLLTAENRKEVADIGVRAARDVLNLQANAVHLCEDGDTLTPVAQTDELTAFLDEVPPLSVTDSIAGRVYRRGEPTTLEDVLRDPDVNESETDLRGHLYLPLAEHGVLIAGTNEEAGFEHQDLGVGELLAGNLVAAFDRVDHEQTARQRQEKLSLFFEESPLGAVQWDDTFQFERVNGRAEEVLGYSETELRGRSWETIVAEADRGRVGDAVEALLAADGGTNVINSNVRKDGEVRTCEWHNRAVTDENGTVQSVFSKFQDVTDRKRRKTELERYETIVEALSDAVYVLDEEGRFTYVNDEFVELVGYDRETIRGNTPSLIKDEDAVRRAEQGLGRLLSSDGPEAVTFEVTIHPHEGDPIVCEDHMGVLPYEGEEFDGSVGTLRDITDRKARERELGTVSSQYQTLVESFPEGAVYLVDTDLNCVRAGGEELARVGLSPDDVEGVKPQALFPEDIAEELRHYYEKALDGTANTFEQEHGGERYRIQTVPVRTDDEKIDHVIAVSQNVSERVENRRELERQNERLEEFASIVSHDLRNPLRVADGRLELIREECESDHIDDVARALDRMDALIEDLLTLAREGERVDEIEPVGLANAATNSWQTVNTGQATLEIETSRALEADQSRLRQLFENFYRNAIEHGGDLRVTVGAMDGGFYVADTGPGIPESDREEVFEAGYSTTETGTGFGLRIVEQIADAHGWEITVTESERGGARFDVTGVEFADG